MDVTADRAFRWECPICSDADGAVLDETGKNALRSLKVHVYYAAGGGHGEARSYPSECPEGELGRYVTPSEGPGDRESSRKRERPG